MEKLVSAAVPLAPTLKQVLDALKDQVLVGRTYLETAKGLLAADRVLLDVAPTFFGLAVHGSLELAQMAIARLYGSISVIAILRHQGYRTAFIDVFAQIASLTAK